MTEQLVIEKHVPIPTQHARGRWQRILDKMQDGYSIKLATKNEARTLQISGIKRGYSMTVRFLPEENKYRVWVVSKNSKE